MPKVGAEVELQTLAECQYNHPAETLFDLQRVRSLYTDLHLYVDFYCFPNKEKKRLVYLAGTVPVQYQGSEYNFPVCIWLHETHPVSRPRCYVCPSASMVINPSCSYLDSSGNISLDALKNWTQGVSNLPLLMSEMRWAFQKDTPLYTKSPLLAPRPASQATFSSNQNPGSQSRLRSASGQKTSQSVVTRAGHSYIDELRGIDFSALHPSSSSSPNPLLVPGSSAGVPPTDPLSRMIGALQLSDSPLTLQQAEAPPQLVQSDGARERPTAGSVVLAPGSGRVKAQLGAASDETKVASLLPQDRAAIFLALMSTEGRSFTATDAMEAVQHSRDLPSALKFLSHCCPICQEQVSFSKIITMTHCSCFLCQSCFKTCFTSAIKEKSIDHLICPQCRKPEVKGQECTEESMEYFNLLDTQIRHFLPPDIHELFQRKLRDHALQDMPNFRWCSHCSFGIIHEADRLRMDCPSCKKSTCCQCRAPWSPQHQGLSCEQFRQLQLQNQPDLQNLLIRNSIECPGCRCVFSLSRGGCLHFTCSQCQHQFCGGCSRTFTPGAACRFSADCVSKGLHAHHPRNCLYHLRDWGVARLLQLLQCYKVPSTLLAAANSSSANSSQTGVCLVLEQPEDGSVQEVPCGQAALPEHGGYCQVHYKEHLVELINHYGCDPAMLFTSAEIRAELQRWGVAVPTRQPEEAVALYGRRLQMTLASSVPLTGRRRSPLLPPYDVRCPGPAAAAAVPAPGALPPRLLLRD